MSLRSREATVAISLVAGSLKLEIATSACGFLAMTPFIAGDVKDGVKLTLALQAIARKSRALSALLILSFD
jgi:hypothetical protein